MHTLVNAIGFKCVLIFVSLFALLAPASAQNVPIESLRKSADQGDAQAQFNLGVYYAEGYGVTKDAAEAVKWYQKAADQGYALAENNLGSCYYNGTGVAKDAVEATMWYRKAADQGDPVAENNLGAGYDSGIGVDKDTTEAVKWFRKAADQGDARAQRNLGIHYEFGNGIEKDAVESLKWYHKAADQGDAQAQYNLGSCYAAGHGVTLNYSQALAYFRAAADQGDVMALSALGWCYANGKGVEKDDVESVKWYRKAAEKGSAHAQNDLGIFLLQGLGVIKNEVEGLAWLYLASANGDQEAARNVSSAENAYNGALITAARHRATELQAQIASNTAHTPDDPSLAGTEPPTPSNTLKASGSGAFITTDGLILTAAHVVEGASRVAIVTATGPLPATVVKMDTVNDVAILKCSGSNFTPLPIAASKTARVGGEVFTLGFPNIQIQGFDPKLTKGEISSLTGMQDDPRDWQVSVPIQPGNSGGPLCDENGNLIGIILATLDPLKMAKIAGEIPQNVNYAVKSSYILPLLDNVPNLLPPRTATSGQKFEDVVAAVRPSTVLILIY